MRKFTVLLLFTIAFSVINNFYFLGFSFSDSDFDESEDGNENGESSNGIVSFIRHSLLRVKRRVVYDNETKDLPKEPEFDEQVIQINIDGNVTNSTIKRRRPYSLLKLMNKAYYVAKAKYLQRLADIKSGKIKNTTNVDSGNGTNSTNATTNSTAGGGAAAAGSEKPSTASEKPA